MLGSTLSTFGKSLFVGTQELLGEVGAARRPQQQQQQQQGPCPAPPHPRTPPPAEPPPHAHTQLAPPCRRAAPMQVREVVQGEIEKVAKDGKRAGRGSRAAARLGAVAASAKYSRWGRAPAGCGSGCSAVPRRLELASWEPRQPMRPCLRPCAPQRPA
jgi:hypothetical protein